MSHIHLSLLSLSITPISFLLYFAEDTHALNGFLGTENSNPFHVDNVSKATNGVGLLNYYKLQEHRKCIF